MGELWDSCFINFFRVPANLTLDIEGVPRRKDSAVPSVNHQLLRLLAAFWTVSPLSISGPLDHLVELAHRANPCPANNVACLVDYRQDYPNAGLAALNAAGYALRWVKLKG